MCNYCPIDWIHTHLELIILCRKEYLSEIWPDLDGYGWIHIPTSVLRCTGFHPHFCPQVSYFSFLITELLTDLANFVLPLRRRMLSYSKRYRLRNDDVPLLNHIVIHENILLYLNYFQDDFAPRLHNKAGKWSGELCRITVHYSSQTAIANEGYVMFSG